MLKSYPQELEYPHSIRAQIVIAGSSLASVEEHAVCKWRQKPKDVKMEGDVAQAREPANETHESNPVR